MTDTQDTKDAVSPGANAPESQAPDSDGAAPIDPPPLLPTGNPPRLLRGGLALGLGVIVAFGIMAFRDQLRLGVPLGALATLVATFGALDLLGSFDDPDERVAGRTTLRALARPLALLFGGLGAMGLLLCLVVAGRLQVPSTVALPRFLAWLKNPVIIAGALIPAAFLTAVVGVYRVGEGLGAWDGQKEGEARPLLRRHGFWLVTATTLLYLPVLGSHSLSDPWETHYGEVAREILARNDWISLWWAQDGWFWSKPILDFWIQALAMATFGVRYQPGQMLSAVREGRVPFPEWAVRLPVFLLTLVAVYLLYKATARVFGRRAGLLGGFVLVTMPQWFLVTHQTMTDMPFVAPMAAAMALFLLGAHTDPHEEVHSYELDLGVTRLRLSGYHLVMGAVVASTLPQVLYLFSRNLTLSGLSLRAHLDAFSAGSPGNCGLPGNESCHEAVAVLRGLHPALQGLIWAQALALILYMNWGERRRQRLYFLAAWFFAALSTMAKGPAGFGLPVLCALSYIVVSRRYRDLLRMEIASGTLILFAVALPWFVAMYARHGQPFTDRLLFHDMFKRAFTHVHDTNEGDDVSFRFYLWQLGYAMFPWTGLVPAGLLYWLRRREEGDRQSDASVFLVMWFLFAFSLFSLMLTKFHHYILPAVPPAAMLTGVLLDALLRRAAPGAPPDDEGPPLRDALAGEEGAGQAGALAGGYRGGPDVRAALAEGVSERFDRAALGAAAMAGAILVFFVGRDMSASFEGMPNQVRLLHLFTYNYRRAWPSSLNFTPTLWAFTAGAAALTFLLFWARARRPVAIGLSALAALFTAWGLDVYFMKTSPHWGQRETVSAYHQSAQETPGPLIAYQMNWKGENFYMGNHVPAFVSSGKKFQDYIAEERKKGIKTFYFMTEHGRIGTLQNEIGATQAFDKLTTMELNNKFLLVRAVFE